MSDTPIDCKASPNPRHIAIIMDGNGRWAQKRFMPRFYGHKAGVKAVKKIVEYCVTEKIEVLSLFAFSSENWRRPKEEVSLLMSLFLSTLQREVNSLHDNNIRLRFIGDQTQFPDALQKLMTDSELKTQRNEALSLVIAVNYGGQWDLTQAFKRIHDKISSGVLQCSDISPSLIHQHLSTADLPDPDLFIRTGGEQRVSNFMLWQLAYAEMYFTSALWPDFDPAALAEAISSFKMRQRRFGQTGEQINDQSTPPAHLT
ncbi:MAG: isoprenyl transferase [Methylovulum sp.]|nr:isoprenyl transferase [Methylovulum sp.]MCF7999348.1 isoprenyl transferase [Methylovulum sp.]